jgi:hypothetical protein
MVIKLIISWLFPLTTFGYLFVLTRFISSVRKHHATYWKSIGDPKLWNANGQIAIFRRVFLPGRFPVDISSRYKVHILFIRVLAFLSLILFVSILLMIWLGMFETP